MQKPRPAVLAGFVIACIALRLMPWALSRFFGMSTDPSTTIYPWNFSPFYATCLFGGALMTRRRDVFPLMLGAWLIGDLGIWLLTGNREWAFPPSQIGVYVGIVLMILCGSLLQKNRTWPAIAGTGLLTAIVFFVVSNFAVWALGYRVNNVAFYQYPHTAGGLLLCYELAIPFFLNSLVSMVIFLPVLFSGYAVKSEATEPVADLAVQST